MMHKLYIMYDETFIRILIKDQKLLIIVSRLRQSSYVDKADFLKPDHICKYGKLKLNTSNYNLPFTPYKQIISYVN